MKRLFNGTAHRRMAGPPTAVEIAESRTLLRTIVVDSLSDEVAATSTVPDGQLTLREALIAANSDAPFGDAPAGDGEDRIRFARGLSGRIALRQGELGVAGAVDIRSYEGITIDAAGESRVLRVSGGHDVYVRGLTFVGGGNVGQGGGVFFAGGDGATLTISGGEFRGNSAFDGGAVAAPNGGRLIFEGVEFHENAAAEDGGAVYFVGPRESRSEMIIVRSAVGESDASPPDNTAGRRGGAIAALGNVRVALYDSVIRKNVAGGVRDGQGGGVFIDGLYGGLPRGRLTVRGETRIGSNVVTGSEPAGGGFYAQDALVSVVGANFGLNSADGSRGAYGGGVATRGGGSFTAVDTVFYNNRVHADPGGAAVGGGIHADEGDSVVILNRSRVERNEALAGGGVYVGEGVTARSRSTVLQENVAGFRSAGRVGGGVLVEGGDYTSTDDQFVRNRVDGGDGGGLAVVDAAARLIRPVFAGNTTDFHETGYGTGHGGGVFIDGGSVDAINAVVRDNLAGEDGGGVMVTGGGVFSSVGLDAAVVDNEAGGRGGGIAATDAAVSVFHGVEGNRAGGDGGGISVTRSEDPDADGSLSLRGNAVLNGNVSGGDGGGLYVRNLPALTDRKLFVRVRGGFTISGNTAAGRGGGVYAEDAAVQMQAGVVENNAAAEDGGGIAFVRARPSERITLDVGAVDVGGDAGNRGGANGGGIWLSLSEAGGPVRVSAGSVRNNHAQTGGGVAVEGSEEAVAKVRGTIFDGNVADVAGGGLSVAGPQVRVFGAHDGQVVFARNAAADFGGAVFAAAGEVRLAGVALGRNSAGEGGGAYVAAAGTLSVVTEHGRLLTSTFRENTATDGVGGGLFCEAEGGLFVSPTASLTFDSNSPADQAGHD